MPSGVSPYDLPYRPRDPQKYSPGIALIGCGGISAHHLNAYKAAGYRVVSFCDLDLARAEQRRDEFYPEALATTDPGEALAAPGVEVADITTHPAHRPPLIEAALRDGKHVLSQKPFVLDLAEGERLADLADELGLLLAVNQNARWAPHFSYLRQAVAAGMLGKLHALHFADHWDHSWTDGTPFEDVRFLILYDYAIHWFDLVAFLMADRKVTCVHASDVFSPSQTGKTPLLGQATITFEDAQASLVFDGHSPKGALSTYVAVGSEGLLRDEGIEQERHQATLITETGEWRPHLEGKWFDDGFHGTMAELLCAIEEERQPSHSARQNLPSLALCFAALQSALTGAPAKPGDVTRMPEA